MTNERIENPVNYVTMVNFSPIFVGGPLIGFIWICLEHGFDWFAIAIAATLGIIAFFLIPGRLEFTERPKEVEVMDSGVILYQRFGRKPVSVPWSGIFRISHDIIEPSKRNWDARNSYLFITEKKTYTLDRQIAEIVRERYRQHMGYYPPNRKNEVKSATGVSVRH